MLLTDCVIPAQTRLAACPIVEVDREVLLGEEISHHGKTLAVLAVHDAIWMGTERCLCPVPLPLLQFSQSHTGIHSLSLVLVVMMKSKELKTKIYSHADSLIHSTSLLLFSD